MKRAHVVLAILIGALSLTAEAERGLPSAAEVIESAIRWLPTPMAGRLRGQVVSIFQRKVCWAMAGAARLLAPIAAARYSAATRG